MVDWCYDVLPWVIEDQEQFTGVEAISHTEAKPKLSKVSRKEAISQPRLLPLYPRGGDMSTGTVECRITFSATLPENQRTKPDFP